jgi:hypothetical protein
VTIAAQLAALVGILGIGLVFGTDAFCALVLRPALARVDDRALAITMGNVHRYGDARMPVPGVVGLVGSAAAALLAALAGQAVAATAAGVALVLLVVWLVLYARISAPINRRLTAAADRGETPAPGGLGPDHRAPRHPAGARAPRGRGHRDPALTSHHVVPLPDRCDDAVEVRLEQEVPAVDELDPRTRGVAAEGLGTGGGEDLVVPTPDREHRHP